MHIWIIMDWNRRWAKKRFLPWIAWHKFWADNVKKIVKFADKIWVKYLTLWALSVDNLEKRGKEEVENIIKIIDKIENYLDEMLKKGLKLNIIWNIKKLPEKSQEILNSIIKKTKNNSWINLTLALVYGWQDEIIRATKKIILSWLNPENISKKEFRKYLDSSFLPNPDLIIRTGWDSRHSWFLLFDSEYSEYYFCEKSWPEFWEEDLEKAIFNFKNSKRNFWK